MVLGAERGMRMEEMCDDDDVVVVEDVRCC